MITEMRKRKGQKEDKFLVFISWLDVFVEAGQVDVFTVVADFLFKNLQ